MKALTPHVAWVFLCILSLLPGHCRQAAGCVPSPDKGILTPKSRTNPKSRAKTQSSARGINVQSERHIEGLVNKAENVGGDIARDRGRRKNARTWKDNNANTMYLD
ncbi:hypothetical protein DFH06DRAFT_1144167 [Mycena polygramma]|nr:hypothetical protein DFH06DRAFT_1144167 [Mycena polygramma]